MTVRRKPRGTERGPDEPPKPDGGPTPRTTTATDGDVPSQSPRDELGRIFGPAWKDVDMGAVRLEDAEVARRRMLHRAVEEVTAMRGVARADLEDLRQEVHVAIVQGKFRPTSEAVKATVWVSIRNRFVSSRRSLAAAQRRDTNLALEWLSNPPTESLESNAIQQEEHDRLRQAYESLSETEKQVLHLRYVVGYSECETARALGLSRYRVQQIDGDARRKLARALGGQR